MNSQGPSTAARARQCLPPFVSADPVVLLIVAALLTGFTAGKLSATQRPELTAFAAAGTTDAMKDLSAAFERRTGIHADLGFAASSTLARQIEAGARADLFISAHAQWMDYLEARDLLELGTRRRLAMNRLVLIVPSESDLPAALPPGDLPGALEGRIAMGDPTHVPAGMYAWTALTRLGVYNALAHRIVRCSSVRAVLSLVESRQVAAGVVYRSDAWISERVRIVDVFPEASHDPIEFQVSLVRQVGPGAAAFLDFLTGPDAQPILASYGFGTRSYAIAPSRNKTIDDPHTAGRWLPTAEEWLAVRTSMRVAAGCVLVLAVPGILLAYLLARRDFPCKAAIEALLHAPLVIPPVVTGYLLLVLLGNNGPIGRRLHEAFGLELAFTLWGAVIASAVMALPLMVRSVRVAMELCDRRLEEAAGTLGAGPVRTFLTVTVPLALPGILSGMILAFARSLGEFGATAVFVGSIEGQSRTLPLAIYAQLQTASGGASVGRLVGFSVVVAVLAMVLSEITTCRIGRRVGRGHAA